MLWSKDGIIFVTCQTIGMDVCTGGISKHMIQTQPSGSTTSESINWPPHSIHPSARSKTGGWPRACFSGNIQEIAVQIWKHFFPPWTNNYEDNHLAWLWPAIQRAWKAKLESTGQRIHVQREQSIFPRYSIFPNQMKVWVSLFRL